MSLLRIALLLLVLAAPGLTPALSLSSPSDPPMDTLPTDDTLLRKDRSEARLRAEGVPVHPDLPPIEALHEVERRSVEVVAGRAAALMVVAAKATGMPDARVQALVHDYGLDASLSPKERAFLANPAPTQDERVQFSWRVEAAYPLFWALGYIDDLGRPDATVDPGELVALLKAHPGSRWVDDARLRPLEAVMDEADLIYRYHWAERQAGLDGDEVPAGLEPGVVIERHRALNWLIGYQGQAWDDVSTDT